MLTKISSFYCLTSLFCLSLFHSVNSEAGHTFQATLSVSTGQGANQNSLNPSISADGSILAFESSASDLILGDNNNAQDIFVKDLWSNGLIFRASVSSTGEQGNNYSTQPKLSADGRFVAFSSAASNLVPNDTNGAQDVFVHDLQSHTTERVSVDSSGNQAGLVNSIPYSIHPLISADGRFVVFESTASNLVGGDANGRLDVFIHDRLNHQTNIVNTPLSSGRGLASISADARYLALTFRDSLLSIDNNTITDVYIYDRISGQFKIASVDSMGATSQASISAGRSTGSFAPSLSADGNTVAFCSWENFTSAPLNQYPNVFLHDFTSGKTTLANANWNFYSCDPVMSADGKQVAYRSKDITFGSTEDFFITNQISNVTRKVVLPPLFYGANSSCPWCNIGTFDFSADSFVKTFSTDWVAGVNGGVLPTGTKDIFWRNSTSLLATPIDFEVKTTQQPTAIKVGAIANFTYSVTNPSSNPAVLRLQHIVSNGRIRQIKPSQGHCRTYALISICSFGQIPPGSTQTVNVSVIPGSAPTLIQKVSVYSPITPDNILTNNRLGLNMNINPN